MAETIFDIAEIKRQAGRLDIQADKFTSTCNDIIKELHSIYDIVRLSGEDIKRWVSVDEYANTFIAIYNKAAEQFHILADEMNAWAEESELEELRASGKIGRLNEPITKISAMLDALK